MAHITLDYQKQWLLNRAAAYGFTLEEDSFEVTHTQWYHFRHGTTCSFTTFIAASYEGLLQVADTELFQAALIRGIGKEKAFGMGLLTITTVGV